MPRGRYDIWMPNLGPSEQLLRSIVSWTEFSRRFRAELFASERIDKRNRTIKNHGQKFTLRLLNRLAANRPVTLMCHCAEEQARCHRHLLQKLLRGKALRKK